MSSLRVTSLKGRTGNQSPTLPDGAVVTGVTTSTSFDGVQLVMQLLLVLLQLSGIHWCW